MEVRRVPRAADVNTGAALRITDLLPRLPTGSPVPLFVFDADYDPVRLTLDLAGVAVTTLVRLRKDRCFHADPDPAAIARMRRPPRHGHTFVRPSPASWLPPTADPRTADPQYGTVCVRAWAGLHPKHQNHAARGARKTRPVVRGTLILVEVSRLPGPPRPRQLLWLWWSGPGTLHLDVVGRPYIRRFDEEHTFRFLKQGLNWTTPHVRHPEQADRWTWLVLAASTQLRLAGTAVQDQRLPGERPRREHPLSPYRVRRAFSAVLLVVGTPANAPKPCGRPPGRPKGRRSAPAPRHPPLKKRA